MSYMSQAQPLNIQIPTFYDRNSFHFMQLNIHFYSLRNYIIWITFHDSDTEIVTYTRESCKILLLLPRTTLLL